MRADVEGHAKVERAQRLQMARCPRRSCSATWRLGAARGRRGRGRGRRRRATTRRRPRSPRPARVAAAKLAAAAARDNRTAASAAARAAAAFGGGGPLAHPFAMLSARDGRAPAAAAHRQRRRALRPGVRAAERRRGRDVRYAPVLETPAACAPDAPAALRARADGSVLARLKPGGAARRPSRAASPCASSRARARDRSAARRALAESCVRRRVCGAMREVRVHRRARYRRVLVSAARTITPAARRVLLGVIPPRFCRAVDPERRAR